MSLVRDLVQRVARGDGPEDVVAAIQDLTDSGRYVALERSWSKVIDLDAVIADYESVVSLIGSSGLGPVTEVVVSAGVLDVPRGPEALHELCAAATDNRVPVMIATESADSVDACIELQSRQLAIGREVGVVLQASLRRTERDCATVPGRVRIVKSGTDAHDGDRFGHAIEIDKSFIRCAKALLRRGPDVEPSFATHDGRIIEIISTIAGRYGRERGDYEFALYLGRGGTVQQRLIDAGERVRVYVPFGPEWLGRLVGGLAERPSGLGSAVRSLLPGA